MPRLTCNPALTARSGTGRTPHAITSRSAGSSVPSSRRTPRTRSSPTTSSVTASSRTDTPSPAIVWTRIRLASASSWRSIRCPRAWTTCTDNPRRARPRAASMPSRPPPRTTTSRAVPAPARICRQSASVRNVAAPSSRVSSSRHSPSIGGTTARLPTASTSASYRVRLPSSASTVRATGSTATTFTPVRRSSAPGGSGRARSSSCTFPASRSESRIRLYARPGSAPNTTRGRRGSRARSSAANRAPAMPFPTTTTLMRTPAPVVRHTP